MSKNKKKEASAEAPKEQPKAEAPKEQPKADHREQIKQMERKKREEALKKTAPVPANKEAEMSYDEWYARRAPSIPSAHRKEILKADFRGRGVGNKASLAKYDEALEKYGVKLKK